MGGGAIMRIAGFSRLWAEAFASTMRSSFLGILFASESMASTEQPIALRRFAWQLGLASWAARVLVPAAIWLFAWGTVMLVARVAFGCSTARMTWGLAGLVPIVLVCAALAWRRRPPRSALLALYDLHNDCNGLLMAAAQADLSAWRARLPPLLAPRVEWRGGRRLLLTLAGTVFMGLVFLMPDTLVGALGVKRLDVQPVIEELTARIETLEKEQMTEAARSEMLKETLAEVARDAVGNDPAKTWESLDYVNEATRQMAAQEAEASAATAARLAAAEDLAGALEQLLVAGVEAGAVSALARELADLLQNEALDAAGMAAALDPDLLAKARAGASLSPEELKQLREALKQSNGRLCDKVARLCNGRLIDPSLLSLCTNAAACPSNALAAFLTSNPGCTNAALCMMPGRGGVSRGRGDAPLTWTDPAGEANVTFKEEVLPPATLAALKESRSAGVSATAPEIETASGAPQAGALAAGEAAGSAHAGKVLPRHRQAVGRYFAR